MSSTETESNPGRPAPPGPRAKAKRQAKAKPKLAPSSGSQDFNLKFLKKRHHLKKSGRDCEYCGFKCFEVAEPFLSGLVTWRSEFSKLGNEAADKELRWIFQVCRRNVSGLAPAVAKSSGKRSFSHDSTETSCEEDKKSRKRVKLDESMTDTSNPSRSSSEALDMEEIKKPRSSEPARKPIILKKAKSPQAGKKRLSTKAPSVDLAKFIRREPQGGTAGGFVCLKASRFFLGIGDGRLSRVACFNLMMVFHHYFISVICFHNYELFAWIIFYSVSWYCSFWGFIWKRRPETWWKPCQDQCKQTTGHLQHFSEVTISQWWWVFAWQIPFWWHGATSWLCHWASQSFKAKESGGCRGFVIWRWHVKC